MGVAIYPRIKGVEAAWAIEISGKLIAANNERLHQLGKEYGVKDLLEYTVLSEEEAAELEVPFEERWFHPDEGIAIIDAMMVVVDANPAAFINADGLRADLDDFKRILQRAKVEERSWNLAMDY